MSFTQWFNNLSNKWVLAEPSIKNLTRSAPKLLYEKKGKDISIGKAIARFFLWPIMITAGKERIKNLLLNESFKGIKSAQNLLEEINKIPFWTGVSKDSLGKVLSEAAISNFINESDEEIIDNDDYLNSLTETELKNHLKKPEHLQSGLQACLGKKITNKPIDAFQDKISQVSRIHSAIQNNDRSKINTKDRKTLKSIINNLNEKNKAHENLHLYRKLVLEELNDIKDSLDNLVLDEGELECTNWQVITHLKSIEKKPTELEFFLSFFSHERNKFPESTWKGLETFFNKNFSSLKETVPPHLHDPLERLVHEFKQYLTNPQAGWKSAEIFNTSLKENEGKIGKETTESAKFYLQDPNNLIIEIRKLATQNETFIRKSSNQSGLVLAEQLIQGKISRLQASTDDARSLTEFIFNMDIMLASKVDPLSQELKLKLSDMRKKIEELIQKTSRPLASQPPQLKN